MKKQGPMGIGRNTGIGKKSSSLSKVGLSVLTMCLVTSVTPMALAAPTGAQVVAGSAKIERNGNQTQITNSNGTIINWQDFSIANDEAVRFLQQNASSAVLNRVVSNIPSSILGELTSNGRVFVINRNGLVIGNNARIDTAGFVGSTLDMTDEDFLAGRMKFSGNGGKLENHGYIATGPNGEVVLIAPTVENHGIIEAKDGRILLAAGREVTLHSAQAGGVSYRISAPEDKAINIGKLVAENGSVRVFADQILQQGTVSANRVSRDADGTIILEADSEIEVSGELSAQGENQAGGEIQVLGDQVTVTNADINASGEGGGKILIGGDYQGKGEVKNAQNTDVDAKTTIRADGGQQGAGGRVIVWSNDTTNSFAKITARGGAQQGDGGFIETSGKKTLNFGQAADASATNGKAGTWLLDPEDIVIDEERASSIETSLNGGSNVEVKTSDTGEGEGNITVGAPITKSEGDDAVTLTLDAHNRVDVNAPITSTAGALNVTIKTGRKVAQANIETTENDSDSSTGTGDADTQVASENATSENTESSEETAQTNTDSGTETTSTDTQSTNESADQSSEQSTDVQSSDSDSTDTVAGTESSNTDAGESTEAVADTQQTNDSNTETDTEASADQSSEVATTDTETSESTESGSESAVEVDSTESSDETVASAATEQSSSESSDVSDNSADNTETDTANSTAQASAETTQSTAQANSTATASTSTASKADVMIDNTVNQVVIKNDIITGGGTVSIDAGESGDVIIGADIDTTDQAGETAGDITVEGNRIVVVDDAQVDASAEEAGEIHVGGGQEGKDESIRNSSQLYTAKGTKISADGGDNGDGGRVILFSEDGTRIDGDVTAKGGSESGDGGFIETSGLKGFVITGTPDASATNGKGGTWLIDPYDITISDSLPTQIDDQNPAVLFPVGGGANIQASLITSQLNSGTNVVISTTNESGGEEGDIRVLSRIDVGGEPEPASLTLNAENNIYIYDSFFVGGDINLNADTDMSGQGKVFIENASAISIGEQPPGDGGAPIDPEPKVAKNLSLYALGSLSVTGNGLEITSTGCNDGIVTCDPLWTTSLPSISIRADNHIKIGSSNNQLQGDVKIQSQPNILTTPASPASLSEGGRVEISGLEGIEINTTGNLDITTASTDLADFDNPGSFINSADTDNSISIRTQGSQIITANDINLKSGVSKINDDQKSSILIESSEGLQRITANSLSIDTVSSTPVGATATGAMGDTISIVSGFEQEITVNNLNMNGRGETANSAQNNFTAYINSGSKQNITVNGTLRMDGAQISTSQPFISPDFPPENTITVQNFQVGTVSEISNHLEDISLTMTVNGSSTVNIGNASESLTLNSIEFINNGTLDWQQGDIVVQESMDGSIPATSSFTNNGQLLLNSPGTFTSNQVIRNTANGVISKTSAGTTMIEAPINNEGGTVIVESGTLEIKFNTYTQTDGETILQGGNLDTNDALLDFQGGVIAGGTNATITTGGRFGDTRIQNTVVEPGFSPGVLTFDQLDASAGGNTFMIEIDGPSSDPNSYDQIIVTAGTIGSNNTLQVIAGPDAPVISPEPAGTEAGSILFNDTYTVITNSGGGAVAPTVSGVVIGVPNTTAVGTSSGNNFNIGITQIAVGTPEVVVPVPAKKASIPPKMVTPTPTPEPEIIVIVIDEVPLALPADIVQTLVSLSEEEQQAYLESERVRDRLRKVNMCVGSTESPIG